MLFAGIPFNAYTQRFQKPKNGAKNFSTSPISFNPQ